MHLLTKGVKVNGSVWIDDCSWYMYMLLYSIVLGCKYPC